MRRCSAAMVKYSMSICFTCGMGSSSSTGFELEATFSDLSVGQRVVVSKRKHLQQWTKPFRDGTVLNQAVDVVHEELGIFIEEVAVNRVEGGHGPVF